MVSPPLQDMLYTIVFQKIYCNLRMVYIKRVKWVVSEMVEMLSNEAIL